VKKVLFEPLKKLVAPIKVQSGVGCTICTLLVGYAEDYLGSNATLAQIETFLNTTVCGLLPSFLQSECDNIVNEYAPRIAQKIFQGFPASVVCQDIGLCSSKINKKTESGIGCTICTLLVGYAEDYLGANATLNEIETFLNTTVCGLLPSFLQPECASIVDEYAPVIAQKIFQGYPASVVCQDIGLCSSEIKPNLMVKLAQPMLLGAIECLTCRLVMNAAEEELGNSSTEAKIEAFLNSTVCKVIPGILRPECANLIDEYLPQLIGHFILGHNATVICEDINMCPPGSNEKKK